MHSHKGGSAMYGKKGGKADKAGGCMGEKHHFKQHTNVSIGKQKSVNFMSDSGHTAPVLDHDKAHSFMPGGTDKRNVGGKRA